MKTLKGFVVGVILMVDIFLIVYYCNWYNTIFTDLYKQSQIDAINGEIYYELEKQNDNTVEWVYNGRSENE